MVRQSQPMPASPLSGRWRPYSAWTGTELLVIGGNTEEGALTDAAAYNPATRTWRSLPSMPARRAGATAVWTGNELLIWGGNAAAEPRGQLADGAAFRPTS
jgi:hypothetical protein